MEATKHDFRDHLSRLGFRVEVSKKSILHKLAKRMGEERFRRFQDVARRADSVEAADQFYDLFRDVHEANLMRSLDPDVTFDTSWLLYEKCRPLLNPGVRVLELGCWTGGLASFIASKHPGCTAIGTDRAQRIIQADRDYFSLPNLNFFCWDYRQNPRPPELGPCHVLLCGLGITNSPDGTYELLNPNAVRESRAYTAQRHEVFPYFAHWRDATQDDGVLFAVLRLTSFARYLAFVDAAADAGWSHRSQHSGRVGVKELKGGGSIPFFMFSAKRAEAVAEDEALSDWIRIAATGDEFAVFSGPLALGLYRGTHTRTSMEPHKFEIDCKKKGGDCKKGREARPLFVRAEHV